MVMSKMKIPSVVLWSTGIFGVLLGTTILVWFCELRWPQPAGSGQRLYEALVDGLKVGLGALIGVMSQWAGRSFAPRASAAGQSREAESVQSVAP